MNKGFIILGHSTDKYVQMAFNCAASIRMHTNTPIALVTDRDIQFPFPVFDHIIKLKPEHNRPFYAKTVINQYSPFDKTIYVDADTFCLSNPDWIFDEWPEFGIQVLGQYTESNMDECKCHWVKDLKTDIYQHFSIPVDHTFTETDSSLILFTKQADELFELAEYFYTEEIFQKYNAVLGHYPDELPWNILLTAINHQQGRWRPIHYHSIREGYPKFKDIEKPIIDLKGDDGTIHGGMWRKYTNVVTGDFLQHYGAYGFKITHRDKAIRNASKVKRWTGLREFKGRPDRIRELIEKWKLTKKGKELKF